MPPGRPAWFFTFPCAVPFAPAAALQDLLVAARARGSVPDLVLVLEHRPVVTLGTRGRTQHLLADEAALALRGVELCQASRGGDVTYHGPGQLVLYPVLALAAGEADTRRYLGALEEVAIRTAACFGVRAFRREGKTGAWTDAGKIAAIGVRFRKWVTSHGMSFNVDVDLSFNDLIVPCGLVGERVASLRTILGGACPSVAEARDGLLAAFCEVFGRRPAPPDLSHPALGALRDLGGRPADVPPGAG